MSEAGPHRRGVLYDGWAPFYDVLLGEAGFSHIWSAFRRARRRFALRFASAADFGCGTGLFLAALARTAPRAALFGVDRSAGMLRVAKRRLAGHDIVLLPGDLRSVRLPQPVDLVTCNFATVNYLRSADDLQSAIANFASHLRARGALVVDFLCAGGQPAEQRFHQRIVLPQMRASWHIRNGETNTQGQVAMRNCLREARGWRCWHEMHEQRWWPLAKMLRCLRDAGLVPLGVAPLGEVPPSRGGRWLQVVAQQT
jgi:SAM-dependent methyltransferase